MAEGMASTDPCRANRCKAWTNHDFGQGEITVQCDYDQGHDGGHRCGIVDHSWPASTDGHEGLRFFVRVVDGCVPRDVTRLARVAEIWRRQGNEVVAVAPVKSLAQLEKQRHEAIAALEVERRRSGVLTRLAEAERLRANIRERPPEILRDQLGEVESRIEGLRSELAGLDAGEPEPTSVSTSATDANESAGSVAPASVEGEPERSAGPAWYGDPPKSCRFGVLHGEGGGDGRPERDTVVRWEDSFWRCALEDGGHMIVKHGEKTDPDAVAYSIFIPKDAQREIAGLFGAVPVDREALQAEFISEFGVGALTIFRWMLRRADALSGVEGSGEGDDAAKAAVARASWKQLQEFDAWLSFRGEYSEVLAAFRSAFGTDTSASALDRVDARPEREDGEPRPFASAEDLRDAATNWRSIANVRMDNLRRVKDELSEARAEVERLNAQMGSHEACCKRSEGLVAEIERLRAAVPLSTETLRKPPSWLRNAVEQWYRHTWTAPEDLLVQLAAEIESQSPPSPAGGETGLCIVRAPLIKTTSGEAVGLMCELPAGHAGDHQAGMTRWGVAAPSPPVGLTVEEAAEQESIIGRIREVARELGYAVAVHGSRKRDLDLIAAPWTVEADDPLTLVDTLCERLSLRPRMGNDGENGSSSNPECKPYGRIGWSLTSEDGPLGCDYIDLSVVPKAGTAFAGELSRLAAVSEVTDTEEGDDGNQ